MSAEIGSLAMPGVVAWRSTVLPRSGKTPGQARQAIKLWLADEHATVRSDALLVISELVTNVIQHVPGGPRRDWVNVRVGLGHDFLRLAVIDPGNSSQAPAFVPLQADATAESGRGLAIVAGLAVRCGTEVIERGRRLVWADLVNGDAGE
ncbi:ATP-binding protein [Nonomuraea sp. NPDC002799]